MRDTFISAKSEIYGEDEEGYEDNDESNEESEEEEEID